MLHPLLMCLMFGPSLGVSMNSLSCWGVTVHLVVVCLFPTVVGAADDSQSIWNDLYAERFDRVKATPTKNDDVAFAAELVSAVATVKKQPDLVTLLCEHAYELSGTYSAGYRHAFEAMRLLATHVPEKTPSCVEAIVRVRQRQFTHARLVKDKQEFGELWVDALLVLISLQERNGEFNAVKLNCRKALAVARQIKSPRRAELEHIMSTVSRRTEAHRLRKRLEANPADGASALRLVQLTVFELDQPEDLGEVAIKHVSAHDKPILKLATRDPDDLSPAECGDVGLWYYGHIKSTKPAPNRTVMSRARYYLKRHVDSKATANSDKARSALTHITGILKLVGGPIDRYTSDDAQASPENATAASTKGLLLHYSFEGSVNGRVRDTSGHSRHGAVGGSESVPGPLGRAIRLDGSGFVDVAGFKGVTGSRPRTMMAWIRTSEGLGPIVGWGPKGGKKRKKKGNVEGGQKWVMRVQGRFAKGITGALRVESTTGSIAGTVVLTDNRWHHVAAVLPAGANDMSRIRLYVDGQPETVSRSEPSAIDTSAGIDVRVGGDPGDKCITGELDEVRIYDRALTDREIAALAGSKGKVAPQIADTSDHNAATKKRKRRRIPTALPTSTPDSNRISIFDFGDDD